MFKQGENRGSKVDEKESGFKPKEKTEETSFEGKEESGVGKESKQQQQQPVEGAVLQAIGETIVEIGKTTTELVAGPRGDEPVVGIEEESTTMKKT